MKAPTGEVPEVRAWRESVVPLESADAVQQRRQRLLPAVERAIVAEGRRRRFFLGWRRQLSVAACALLLAAAGIGIGRGIRPERGSGGRAELHVFSGTARLLHRDRAILLGTEGAASSVVDDGDVIATASDGSVALFLASGASVAVEAETRLSLEHETAASEIVRLEAGVVDVHVPKIGSARQFAVRTADALVTVHGTAFSVAFGGGRGDTRASRTRVTVTDGVVGVQCKGMLERRVFPGDSLACSEPSSSASEAWTAVPVAPMVPAQSRTGATSATSAATSAEDSVQPARGPNGSPSATRTTGSALADENRAFAEAMAASRGGDYERAANLLQRFLERHPASTLAQEASVEAFRALVRLGEKESASRAAARYLMLYRDGFARDEARRVAMGIEASSVGPDE